MGTIKELPNGNLLVRIDYVFSRHGGRKKIIVAGNSSEISSATHDSSVINTIARAYRWRKLLDTGKIKSVQELANAVNLDRSYVARVLRLTYLAPGIVQRFLNGTAPSGLSLATLHKAFPDNWEEQYKFFGIN